MRRALIACALLGCTEQPNPPDVEATSHVVVFDWPSTVNRSIDVLFVVDDTAAMAPYQDRLVMLAQTFEQVMVPSYLDLQISVATSNSFLVHRPHLYTPPTTSYDGTLGNALAARIDVGTASAGPAQLLATMQQALATPGFVRPNAYLAIVIVSASDDGSAITAVDAASALKQVKAADPSNVMVSGIYARPAEKLDAFLALFPNRNVYTSIEATDYTLALEPFKQLIRTTLGLLCIDEPADVDPNTAGAQYECAITGSEDQIEQRLPLCPGAERCLELVPEPNCSYDGTPRLTPKLHGFPYWPTIKGQCVAR